jgi:hypothetical protein
MTTTPRPRVSRGLRLLVTAGALVTISTWSLTADAKKQHKLKMDPAVDAAADPKGPVPPEPDAAGHVNFGNPQAQGLGRVTVKAAKGDQIQVYLEGRYFGDTPVTIYSVPKGDYIVEGTFVASGKQVAKPVSVSENEEATVELVEKKVESPEAAAAKTGFMSGDISPARLRAAKILAVTSGVALLAGVWFGYWEMKASSDYEKTPEGSPSLMGISDRGRRDALLCNVGFTVAGLALVGAAVAAYPMFKKPNAEQTPEEPPPTAFLTPIIGHGTTGGAFTLRF